MSIPRRDAETPYLALLAAGTIIATGAIWAVLQAVDGVTLKQTVDAWAAASATDKATRFADAETARWIEWACRATSGFCSAFLLLGAAAVVSRLVPSWFGVLLVGGGLRSLALGFSVCQRSAKFDPVAERRILMIIATQRPYGWEL
jgi:hypothetical protein